MAVGALHGFDEVDASHVVTCGHSAGGQLALWAAGRQRFPDLFPPEPDGVDLLGAVSLAGVVDLVEADRRRLGAGAVSEFLGAHFERHPERDTGARLRSSSSRSVSDRS